MSEARWKHRRGDVYRVVECRIVGNAEHYEFDYFSPNDNHPTIAAAKSAGFRSCECDDFNIAAIRNGRLVAMLWMDEIVDDEDDVLDRVADLIGARR